MTKRYYLLLLFLMGSPLVAFAQLTWEKITLFDTAQYLSLAVSPSNSIFATSKNGIYKSTDEGNSWRKIDTARSVYAMCIDSSGVIYYYQDNKLFHSSNDGITWHIDTIADYYLQYLEAGRDTAFILAYTPKVYKTINHGSTWSNIGFYFPDDDIDWSNHFASPSGYVFGAFRFASATVIVNSGIGIGTEFSNVMDNDPISWAMFDNEGFAYGSQGGKLIRSSNEGFNWEPIDSFVSPTHRYWGPYGVIYPKGIIVVTDTETVISYDHTQTWSRIGKGVYPATYPRKFATTRKGTLFYISDSGIYKSTFFASVRPQNSSSILREAAYDRKSNSIIIHGFENEDHMSVDVYDRNVFPLRFLLKFTSL
jgi:photosystem II stability/assembly factor-like uncharacterized protein